MKETNTNNKNNISIGDNKSLFQLKDDCINKDEIAVIRLNNFSNKKTEFSNDNIKNKGFMKNSLTFSKEQTKSRVIDKRFDIFGNLITHGGKQKISFIDKISKNNFIEVIKIESFKEFNKMEEVAPRDRNGCCLLI